MGWCWAEGSLGYIGLIALVLLSSGACQGAGDTQPAHVADSQQPPVGDGASDQPEQTVNADSQADSTDYTATASAATQDVDAVSTQPLAPTPAPLARGPANGAEPVAVASTVVAGETHTGGTEEKGPPDADGSAQESRPGNRVEVVETIDPNIDDAPAATTSTPADMSSEPRVARYAGPTDEATDACTAAEHEPSGGCGARPVERDDTAEVELAGEQEQGSPRGSTESADETALHSADNAVAAHADGLDGKRETGCRIAELISNGEWCEDSSVNCARFRCASTDVATMCPRTCGRCNLSMHPVVVLCFSHGTAHVPQRHLLECAVHRTVPPLASLTLPFS